MYRTRRWCIMPVAGALLMLGNGQEQADWWYIEHGEASTPLALPAGEHATPRVLPARLSTWPEASRLASPMALAGNVGKPRSQPFGSWRRSMRGRLARPRAAQLSRRCGYDVTRDGSQLFRFSDHRLLRCWTPQRYSERMHPAGR